MSNVVGGVRSRLIRQSLYTMLSEALEALGWSDTSTFDLTFIDAPFGNDDVITLNTLALSSDDIVGDEVELGSNLEEERWTHYLDFYASKESLAMHLAHDLRDILRGKMASINRNDSTLTVYDWRAATPPELFTVFIEDVVCEPIRDGTKPWQKHWYVIRFDTVDTYGDEDYPS